MSAVLITGASSGLGEEFAREYARRGRALVLVARREERLKALAAQLRERPGVNVYVLGTDLSEMGAVERVMEFCRAERVEVATLVNNAGFGGTGRLEEMDGERLQQMIALNVGAVVGLTRAFLPGMKARGAGEVLNVASTAAFQPTPFLTVYGATKAFVLSFSEGLHEELRGTGVRVTALCPGPTATGFFDAAQLDAGRLSAKLEPVDVVVKRGIKALEAGVPVVVSGMKNRVLASGGRLLPRGLVRRAAAGLLRPR